MANNMSVTAVQRENLVLILAWANLHLPPPSPSSVMIKAGTPVENNTNHINLENRKNKINCCYHGNTFHILSADGRVVNVMVPEKTDIPDSPINGSILDGEKAFIVNQYRESGGNGLVIFLFTI